MFLGIERLFFCNISTKERRTNHYETTEKLFVEVVEVLGYSCDDFSRCAALLKLSQGHYNCSIYARFLFIRSIKTDFRIATSPSFFLHIENDIDGFVIRFILYIYIRMFKLFNSDRSVFFFSSVTINYISVFIIY